MSYRTADDIPASVHAFIALFWFLLAAAVFSGGHYLQCRAQADKISEVTDYSYGPTQGCMWKVKGNWAPSQSYRNVSER